MWGAEPILAPVRDDATLNQWLSDVGELGGYSGGGRTGGALRRSLQWEREHFRINLSKSLAQNCLLLNTGAGLYSVGTFDLSEQR